MHLFSWKPRAKQQFSAGRAILRSSRTVAGQFQLRSGMHPFGWKPRVKQHFSAGGSAQEVLNGGLRGGRLYGLPGAEITGLWHKEKATLGKTDLEQPERERILYRLVEICTTMMRDNRGRVGDVARSLSGVLVTLPIDPDYIRRYFGESKRFPKIDELITIVSGGVPVIAPPSQADVESALRYGNHRSAEEHLPLIWKKNREDVRREKCLVIEKMASHEIPNVRVLPLGAVATHKVRVVNDLFFDRVQESKKEGPQRRNRRRQCAPKPVR